MGKVFVPQIIDKTSFMNRPFWPMMTLPNKFILKWLLMNRCMTLCQPVKYTFFVKLHFICEVFRLMYCTSSLFCIQIFLRLDVANKASGDFCCWKILTLNTFVNFCRNYSFWWFLQWVILSVHILSFSICKWV